MTSFLITYDNHPPRNYVALYQLMAAWKAVRMADSVWLANLNGTAAEVRSVVLSKLQSNDRVAVLELKQGSGWATINVDAAANAWLSANVSPSQKAA